MRFLIFGHGYTASYLTPRLKARGWGVSGTTRTGAGTVMAAGAEPLIWPGDEAAVAQAISAADGVLISVGPSAGGCPVLAAWGDAIAATRPPWLGYLSSTAVYGDAQGGWVDEDSPLEPASVRGAERVAAERGWQALADKGDLPLMIFRLAGIYGPGRGPLEKLRAGTARRIVKPNQIFSRIHVEDIAQVLLASIDQPHPGAVWNVCDDEPVAPEVVLEHAALLLDLPVPAAEGFETAEMSPMARSFYGESKRVSNARIKRDLGVAWRYPDYRAGLASLLEAEAACPEPY